MIELILIILYLLIGFYPTRKWITPHVISSDDDGRAFLFFFYLLGWPMFLMILTFDEIFGDGSALITVGFITVVMILWALIT